MTKLWWQPPQLRSVEDSEQERHATWLELFYDLVFVVAITQLADNLYEHSSLSGFFGFVMLFVPIWWSWIGSVFYANRFDTDDLGHRLLTVAQMLAIAALSINVHNGLDEGSVGFALSYAAVRAVLVVNYLRTIDGVVVARPLTVRLALGFALAAVIWLVSAFVPEPIRFALWGLGLTVDFATPISAGQLHLQVPLHISHLAERFGLFTLIVLGESIIAVVDSIAEQQWNIVLMLTAVFGLSIAFSLWWIYFECVDSSPIQRARAVGRVWIYHTWLYTHLPLAIGLTATGVGVEKILLSEPDLALTAAVRWLICGAVALCLLALGVIHFITVPIKNTLRSEVWVSHRIGAAAFVLVLATVGVGLLPVVLLGLVAVACAVQVALDLYIRSKIAT
ncbi:MAG: low temperature requirement protein A [Fischerella sp.]|nr:low temperature requirement protein A [Fischerella sp.]